MNWNGGERGGPLWAGLLVGGGSRRMGRPKALLELAGDSLAERALAAVIPRVDGVALLGSGKVPAALHDLPRLADVAGVDGPMAGVLAATALWMLRA